ncbi:trypsin-like cysteine/serine peptidase domain-containing protein [Absidia repens]|uniref:Trypsin-like cysteine/serine peptidase domain-containing protein n=1 Tax=Absidia repens TaxID=90262 RepID=A0A1X2I874_9FUNG|nr:trypsin-like cysteine/serine peptidase domain-containing protein [Absidia repens]
MLIHFFTLVVVFSCTQTLVAATTTSPKNTEWHTDETGFSVPWLVSIGPTSQQTGGYSTMAATHKCVGIVLHPMIVLTVAHCVQHAVKTPTLIGVGAMSTTQPNTHAAMADARRRVPVGQILIHPNNNPSAPVYDVAILKTVAPVMPYNVPSARLLSRSIQPNTIQPLYTMGWAGPVSSSSPSDLKAVPLMFQQNCKTYQYLVCTKSQRPGDALCHGDEGAPLIVNINGQPVVTGFAFTPDYIPTVNPPQNKCIGESTFIQMAPIIQWIHSVVGNSLLLA